MSEVDAGVIDPVAELCQYEEQQRLPKAFAVPFADLGTWSVTGFYSIDWNWPAAVVLPLGEALERRTQVVTGQDRDERELITIRFDGSIEQRAGDGSVKGKLYAVEPGDLVYSKIDIRHGAIGVVQDELAPSAVTSEYPVYEVRPEIATSNYVKLLVRLGAIKTLINGMIAGASGRKRVNPDQLESLEVPMPPLDVQRRIVARHRALRTATRNMGAKADRLEQEADASFLIGLGLNTFESPERPKAFGVTWDNLVKWSGSTTHLLKAVDGALSTSRYPIASGNEVLRDVRNGCSAGPSRKPTGLEVLKISAVTRGRLRLSEKKHIRDDPRFRAAFDLKAGDVLMCRTNGTLDYVGRPAVVAEDLESFIFPDKIIRLRLDQAKIRPRYLWRVLQIGQVRAQIEAAARTAVGNYAIGGSDVWDLRIPVPPLDVQDKLVAAVDSLRAEAAHLRRKAEEARQLGRAEVELMILGRRPVPEGAPDR